MPSDESLEQRRQDRHRIVGLPMPISCPIVRWSRSESLPSRPDTKLKRAWVAISIHFCTFGLVPRVVRANLKGKSLLEERRALQHVCRWPPGGLATWTTPRPILSGAFLISFQ